MGKSITDKAGVGAGDREADRQINIANYLIAYMGIITSFLFFPEIRAAVFEIFCCLVFSGKLFGNTEQLNRSEIPTGWIEVGLR